MGEHLTPLHLQQALVPCIDLVYNYMNVDPVDDFIGDAAEAYGWQGEIWGVPAECNGVGSMVNVPTEDVIAVGLEDQYPPLNGEVFFESYESMWELGKALQVEEGGQAASDLYGLEPGAIPAGAWVVLSVQDTGIGIPAEDLDRIFERFYKTDRARSSGGTGLGLAISKHIVQAHGGQIWAKSREGQGSTFYFTLPVV